MTLQRDKVILVNEHDEWMQIASKEEAHRTGALHRALSIFITNSNGELLLQQRAMDKYHSGGLWSNACCSHPAPGEPTMDAAHRRLHEELGFDTVLTEIGTVKYRAEVTAGLTEHEYDHIYTGSWDGDILPAPEEINAVQWITPDALEVWMQREPRNFTAWFPILLDAWKGHATAPV